MSRDLVCEVLDECHLIGTTKLVLVILARHASNSNRSCYLKVSTIAKEASCNSERTIQRALNELVVEKYLDRQMRHGRSSVFTLLTPPRMSPPVRNNIGPDPAKDVTPPRMSPTPAKDVTVTPPRMSPITKELELLLELEPLVVIEKKPYREIIEYLNEKSGKTFRWQGKDTQRHINARLAEGHTVDNFKRVVDNQCARWKHDARMNEYLRPITLFGSPQKFEGYLNAEPIAEALPFASARGADAYDV